MTQALTRARARQRLTCPGCRAPMERRSFDRQPLGGVDLDLCFDCRAIWFDQFESLQLTAGAVIELFRIVNDKTHGPVHALAQDLRCPRCPGSLKLTRDMQRGNPFSYHRCAEGHGRLTTFLDFLREKNFVRSLTNPELEKLRENVQQVRCSSCGAPVNVERDAKCAYCRAPLSILDVGAVKRTLNELGDREHTKRTGQDLAQRLAWIQPEAHEPRNEAVDLVEEMVEDFLKGLLS